MRIISGRFRGKKLYTPAGLTTRPTSDRAKESIFNILNSYTDIKNSIAVDIFAGSGALGIEALSRGAQSCLFVEKDKTAIKTIRHNISSIGMDANASYLNDCLNLSSYKKGQFDIIFMDPPYNKGLITIALSELAKGKLTHQKTIIIAECDKEEVPEIPEDFSIIDTRIYGKAKILFLKSTKS